MAQRNFRKIPVPTEKELIKFHLMYVRSETCWNVKSKVRYPGFRLSGKRYLSYRIMWFIHTGNDPGDKLVCHKCDNPLCLNPNHLFLGTNQDNVDDMLNKHRGSNQKLTAKDIPVIRSLGKTHLVGNIARMFNVHQSTISLILSGKRWGHIKENE